MAMDEEKAVQDECEKDGFKEACILNCSGGLDLELGFNDRKVFVEKSEKDCRICSLDLESSSCREFGFPMALGCLCKDDLASAHQKCAERWFKIKGDWNCEICGSMVKNLVGFHAVETTGSSIGTSDNPATATQTQWFCQGKRLLSCLLGGFLVITVICFVYKHQLK
ncbi:hypothetical protein KSP39_PZI018344 [Platanthera zijinensis]|uniref:RING-CH-type domain-containing protein n=1 Tax=Platanthera zijinensis TaxID=2320716 RepID=A0AAP0FYW1_9ASPA